MIIDKSGSMGDEAGYRDCTFVKKCYGPNEDLQAQMEKLVAEMSRQKTIAIDDFLHKCLNRLYPRLVASWTEQDGASVFPLVRKLLDATEVKYYVDNASREEKHQVCLGNAEIGVLRIIYNAGTLHKLEGYAEKITRFRVHNRHVRIFVWNCTQLLSEIGNRAKNTYIQLYGVPPEATVEEIPNSVASIIIKDREGGE